LSTLRVLLSVTLALSTAACGGGSGGSSSGDNGGQISRTDPASWVLRWNQIAIDASGFDHKAEGAKEQAGPTKSARAMAIVHLAMFAPVTALAPRFTSYTEAGTPPEGASMKSAIAQAAHDTLVALFPSQQGTFNAALSEDFALIDDPAALTAGA